MAFFSAHVWGKFYLLLAFNLFVAQLSLMSVAAVSAQHFDKSTLNYPKATAEGRKNH